MQKVWRCTYGSSLQLTAVGFEPKSAAIGISHQNRTCLTYFATVMCSILAIGHCEILIKTLPAMVETNNAR
jgi:hypothetical protein